MVRSKRRWTREDDCTGAFIGGPTQVVVKMITGDAKEYTVLNCVVSQTDIKKGVANISAAVIDTEYARIVGKGKVNFGTEELSVVVTPEPRSAPLHLGVAVKVGGTLGDPSYGLDEFSVCFSDRFPPPSAEPI